MPWFIYLTTDNDLQTLMTTVANAAYGIPSSVVWGAQSGPIYAAMSSAFMQDALENGTKKSISPSLNFSIISGNLRLF